MKHIEKFFANQKELLPSVIGAKKIEALSKRLVVLKCMLGILMFAFVAIVVEII